MLMHVIYKLYSTKKGGLKKLFNCIKVEIVVIYIPSTQADYSTTVMPGRTETVCCHTCCS